MGKAPFHSSLMYLTGIIYNAWPLIRSRIRLAPTQKPFPNLKLWSNISPHACGTDNTLFNKIERLNGKQRTPGQRDFACSLKEDIADSHNPDTELQHQYNSFKKLLILDIDPDLFADLYAQTIAYGICRT